MNEVELHSRQALVTLNAFLLLKKYESRQDGQLFNLKKHLALISSSISQGCCRVPGCRNTHYCQLFRNRISSYICLFSLTLHGCRGAQDITRCDFVLFCFGVTLRFPSVPFLCSGGEVPGGWHGHGALIVAKVPSLAMKGRKQNKTLKGSADEWFCILEHFKKNEIKSWDAKIAWWAIIFMTELCIWDILCGK